jgi:THO complex subunit 1
MLMLKLCNSLLKQCSNRDVDAEFAGSIMITLSHVFPLSERSAMNVLGSFNVENCTVFEGREEFERGALLRMGGEDGAAGEDSKSNSDGVTANSLGYEFYSTFWGVQKVFTDPMGTILASSGGVESLESFVKDIKTILAAFESTPAIASSKSTSEQVSQYKYLTSSQLLHLQLKDPEIRTHFLTQLLILLSHLSSSSAILPTASTKQTAGSTNPKSNSELKQTQSQLSNLEKRTQQLLKSIKPHGEDHLRAICWIFKERESMWRHWKKNKCAPPLEKMDDRVGGGLVHKVLSGKKRKIGTVETGYENIDLQSDLPGVVNEMKSNLSGLDAFLEPYVEACDPEAEVDAEYHPANDSVYCWRGLRLMARSQVGEGQLRRFGYLRRRDGNFEGIVRDMWKVDKGEDIPGAYVDVEDEEALFRPKRAEKADAAVADAEMEDAASVGTPEVDEKAKKEKMAEFEKAAMEVEEDLFSDNDETDAAAGDADKSQDAPSDSNDKSTQEGDDRNGSAKQDAKVGSGNEAVKEEADSKDGSSGEKAKAEGADKPSSEEPDEGGNNTIEPSTEEAKVKADVKSEEDKTPATSKVTPSNGKHEEELIASQDKSASAQATAKSASVEESSSNSNTKPSSQATTKKSYDEKEPKPTAHSVKPTAKFTPKEQLRGTQQQQQQQQRSKDQAGKQTQVSTKEQPNKNQKMQDRSIDKSQSSGGPNQGQNRDLDVRQDRRDSDSRRGPPHQQHPGRGGRFNTRDERNDGYHGAQSQGRGRGWQPPTGRGRGGRDISRGRSGRGGRR